MDFSFRPKLNGRAGAQIVHVSVPLGTLTANNTTDVLIPVHNAKAYVVGASFTCETVVADSDGTVIGVLKKYRGSDDTEVTISSNFDLETAVAKEANAITVNGGDAARTLQRADTLRFEVTNNSAAFNTPLAQGWVTVELAVLE